MFLVGGATGLIGDPSLLKKKRILKTEKEVEKNVGAIKKQLSRFFDFDKTAVLAEQLRLVQELFFHKFHKRRGKKFTISEMIAKEAVKEKNGNRDFFHRVQITP